MKVKDILKKFEGFDPETEVDLIVSDSSDNWDAKDICTNNTPLSGDGRIELDITLDDSYLVVAEKEFKQAKEREQIYLDFKENI